MTININMYLYVRSEVTVHIYEYKYVLATWVNPDPSLHTVWNRIDSEHHAAIRNDPHTPGGSGRVVIITTVRVTCL